MKIRVTNDESEGGKTLNVAVYELTEDGKKNVTNQIHLAPGDEKTFVLNEGKEFELHELIEKDETKTPGADEYSGHNPKAAS